MATFEEVMRDAVANRVIPGAVLVATNTAGLWNPHPEAACTYP